MQALRCIADMNQGMPQAQEALLAASITLGGQATPALHVAIHFALHSPDAGERAASLCMLRAFANENERGAAALLDSVGPGKGPVSGVMQVAMLEQRMRCSLLPGFAEAATDLMPFLQETCPRALRGQRRFRQAELGASSGMFWKATLLPRQAPWLCSWSPG